MDAASPCKCLAKSSDRETGSPRYSLNWALAKRGMAKIHADRIEHGNRVVLFSDVVCAKRYEIGGFAPWSKGYVLVLDTDARTYSFGFTHWCQCLTLPNLNVEEPEDYDVGVTRGAIVLRVLYLFAFIYLIWKAFF